MAGLKQTIDNRMVTWAQKRIDQIMQDARWDDIDDRLTPGQQHAQVKEVLGAEPLVFAGRLLALAVAAKSKITIAPAEAAKIAIMINDRIYGPPDVRIRKGSTSDNSFQLEFAWATGDVIDAEPELVLAGAKK